MLSVDTHLDPNDDTQSVTESKSRRVSKKASDSVRSGSSTAKKYKLLVPGSTVRVVSGTFAEFVGSLKKVNRKTGKVCPQIIWLKVFNIRKFVCVLFKESSRSNWCFAWNKMSLREHWCLIFYFSSSESRNISCLENLSSCRQLWDSHYLGRKA